MNEEARRLRAQKAYSTDSEYLERMAREAEARGLGRTAETAAADEAPSNMALPDAA